MFKIKIITVGKTKEKWLQLALAEYEKRLSSRLLLEWVFAKDDQDLASRLGKEENFFCLDPQGELVTSIAFSNRIFELFEKNKCKLTFLIGGPSGLDPLIKKRSRFLLSLSPLTLTHQITRLVFLEQLFRSFEIKAHSPYHK